MKKCGLATIVVLAAALLVAACGSGMPQGTIATVGKTAVTQAQFDAIIKQSKAQAAASGSTFPKVGSSEYNQYAAQVVQYLVGQEVINQAAVRMGLSVTSKDVADSVKQLETANGGAAGVNALLKQYGMTRADLNAQTKAQLIGQAVSAKVVKDAKIAAATDAQALAYYQKNKSKYVTPEKRDVREILVGTKAQALKVRALLVARGSWQTLAKKYSIDTGSKDKGGLYTSVAPGEMVAAFDKAAFSLPLMAISQPVKTQYGWHIIMVTKITKGSTTSFAKAKASVKTTLLQTQQQTVWTDWLSKATKDAKVIYAAGYDPAKLAATTSPSASASSSPSASAAASSTASPSPSQTP
jgi:parvulin-like peptidyl-prolyl isomerase